MSRTKYRSTYLAEHDAMTGLKNRRGLEFYIWKKIKEAPDNSKIFAIMIDMDGLKKRNDTYGHNEGDNGILIISKAAQSITDAGEICVRGGGDEFMILGVGQYTDNQLHEKLSRFYAYLDTVNETQSFPVSASIGYALKKLDKEEGFQVVLDKADEKMYENKRSKK